MASTGNIALLIDADNASPSGLDDTLTVLAELGTVNIKRAYGNWSKAGLRSNYENFVVRSDGPVASAFAANFESLWAVAQPREACACDVTTDECKTRYCLGTATPE